MNTLAARNDALFHTSQHRAAGPTQDSDRHLRVPALAGLPQRAPAGTMTPRI